MVDVNQKKERRYIRDGGGRGMFSNCLILMIFKSRKQYSLPNKQSSQLLHDVVSDYLVSKEVQGLHLASWGQ